MNPQNIIAENFIDHTAVIPRKTSGMDVLTIGNLIVVDSGLPCDTFNIIHVRGSFGDRELSNALDTFRKNDAPFCLWIRKEHLNASAKELLSQEGLKCQAEEAGMTLDLSQYEIISSDKHEHIKHAETPGMIRAFSQVIAENWSPPDDNVISYYSKTAENFLSSDQFTLFTYYQENFPVATVEVFATNEKIAGIHGLATLEDTRGQGIGSALMTRALNDAKARGFETMVLLATADGIGIYQKLGFKSHTTFYEFA